jgi:calmodulin
LIRIVSGHLKYLLGSGFLERQELEEVMNNVAQDLGVDPPSSEEVDEVLKELDENGDGKLSIDEFQVLIEQVLEMMSKVE